ncbi:MAG: hypothetical protein ACTSU2_07435 [Promethearchaeota archaeon]
MRYLNEEAKEFAELHEYFEKLFREAREKVINENKEKYERYMELRGKIIFK